MLGSLHEPLRVQDCPLQVRGGSVELQLGSRLLAGAFFGMVIVVLCAWVSDIGLLPIGPFAASELSITCATSGDISSGRLS